jgi:isoleucyl-tRNA synthetase
MDKIHLEAMASVHLQQYPVLSSFNANKDVTDKMDIVRKICSSVLFIRKKHNIRTRMPLEYIKIVGLKHAIFHDFEDIIKNETNVKSIFFIEFNNIKIEKTAKLNFKSIGTKFGNNVSQITSLVKASKWTQNNDGDVIIGDLH